MMFFTFERESIAKKRDLESGIPKNIRIVVAERKLVPVSVRVRVAIKVVIHRDGFGQGDDAWRRCCGQLAEQPE